MESSREQLVDMSKLTERELLIRLYDKLETLAGELKTQKAVAEAKDAEVACLKERVIKLEVRLYTISGVAVFISGVLGLTLNFYRTINP